MTKVADAHGATVVAVPGQRAVDLMGALEDPVKIPVRLRRLHQDPVKIPVRLRRGNQDPVEVHGNQDPVEVLGQVLRSILWHVLNEYVLQDVHEEGLRWYLYHPRCGMLCSS